MKEAGTNQTTVEEPMGRGVHLMQQEAIPHEEVFREEQHTVIPGYNFLFVCFVCCFGKRLCSCGAFYFNSLEIRFTVPADAGMACFPVI